MARPPKKRESYLSDAQRLISIAKAIARDDRLPVEWKLGKEARLIALATELMNAPLPSDAGSTLATSSEFGE